MNQESQFAHHAAWKMKEKHENDNGDEKSGILTVYPQININETKKLTYGIYQLFIIQSIRRIRNKTNVL